MRPDSPLISRFAQAERLIRRGIVEQSFDVVAGDALGDRFNRRAWIQCVQPRLRRLHLAHADISIDVQDLALQVAAVDDIVIDETDRAHSGRREVERGR